mmetsp:Transcript_42190/g.94432  ORF Transcript_42190/g.94432 Transcript_42190/m.94432 type:complete len:172 (-) Transcript_42190:290-805(-)
MLGLRGETCRERSGCLPLSSISGESKRTLESVLLRRRPEPEPEPGLEAPGVREVGEVLGFAEAFKKAFTRSSGMILFVSVDVATPRPSNCFLAARARRRSKAFLSSCVATSAKEWQSSALAKQIAKASSNSGTTIEACGVCAFPAVGNKPRYLRAAYAASLGFADQAVDDL